MFPKALNLISMVCIVLLSGLASTGLAEEEKPKEDAKPEQPKKEAAKPGQGRNQAGRRRGGFGGFGGGDWFGRRGMFGGGQDSFLKRMVDRMLSTTPTITLSQILSGPEESYVMETPPGGIGNLRGRSAGWKAEEVFVVDEAQQKKLDQVREEYKKELEHFQEFLNRFHAMAAREAGELRRKYEIKANAVLEESVQKRKNHLDEVTWDYFKMRRSRGEEQKVKANELVEKIGKEMAKAREAGGAGNRELFQEGMDFARESRELMDELARENVAKMKEGLEKEEQEKLEALIKKAEERAQTGWGRRRRPGGDEKGKEQPAQKQKSKGNDQAPVPPPKEEF